MLLQKLLSKWKWNNFIDLTLYFCKYKKKDDMMFTLLKITTKNQMQMLFSILPSHDINLQKNYFTCIFHI